MAHSSLLSFLATIAILQIAAAADLTLFKRGAIQHFDAYPIGATILAGTRVTLICNASADVTPVPQIQWFLRGFGASQEVDIGRDPNLQINYTISPPELVIRSFSKSVEGEYECSYRDRSNTTHIVVRRGGFFSLYVAVAPSVTAFTIPNVNVSGTTTLTCSSSIARPVPDYMEIWRESRRLARAESTDTITHQITNARTSDAGEYRCVAENMAGKREGKVSLVVQTVPKVISLNGTAAFAPRGSSDSLVCSAAGIPDPVILWRKNGAFFREGSPLNFSNLKESDTAKYTCVGRNDAGQKTAEINFYVQIRPDAPTNVSFGGGENISITVSWKSPDSDGHSQIIAYEVQHKLPSDSAWITSSNFTEKRSETSFTVRELEPYTEYDFRARAQNSIGIGPYSSTSTLRTQPNAPSVGPSNLVNGTVGQQTAMLGWDLPVGVLASDEAFVVRYEVAYAPVGGAESNRFTNSNTSTSLTLTDLSKGTTYEIAVYARNSGPYRSPPSNGITIVTETSLPSAPSNFAWKSDATSIALTWEAPLDAGGLPVLHYNVEYSAASDDVVSEKLPDSAELARTIDRLLPARDYVVRVRAVNRRGAGEWATRNAKTKASTKSVVLTPTNVLRNGETQIELRFAETLFDAYDVRYWRAGPRSSVDSEPAPDPSEWTTKTIPVEKGGIVRLENLVSASVYYVAVKPSRSGFGNYSEPLKTYTQYFLRVLELIAEPKSFKIGETVTLTCRTPEGDVPDRVTFYFDDKKLSSPQANASSNEWLIGTATERDDGTYRCEDGEGHEGTTTVQLAGKFESDKSSDAPIAGGITVAVIILICVLIALVWYCRSRSKKKHEDEEEGQPSTTPATATKKKESYADVTDAPPPKQRPPPPFELKPRSPPPYSSEPAPGAQTVSIITRNPGYGQVAPKRGSSRISESPSPPRREISPPRETAV